jgi:hypothetical protein
MELRCLVMTYAVQNSPNVIPNSGENEFVVAPSFLVKASNNRMCLIRIPLTRWRIDANSPMVVWKKIPYIFRTIRTQLKTIYYVNLFFRFASSSLYTLVHFPATLRLSLAQFASLQMFFWVATWGARARAALRASWRPYFVIRTLF